MGFFTSGHDRGLCESGLTRRLLFSDPDVTFFHPPSIFDFRERPEVLGPISDVIPSSPVFEMYPIGLTSLADRLEGAGYNARIINLAREMLTDPDYDPEADIAACTANIYAIDLHWLPHAHGAIEVARLVKKHHPDAPVIFGGLSSTYYHEELIEYPSVDYVLRGDSTEEPMEQLVDALTGDGDVSDVPNLTYRDGGETTVNPLTYQPDDLDDISVPSYTYAIRSVLKYGSLRKVLPHKGWLDKPITMLLTSRGCRHACSFCGGADSYADVHDRPKPAFRSPERLIEDVRTITAFSEGPIFIVHDLRQGGWDYATEFFELLAEEDIENEFIFELFGPAPAEYFELIDDAVERYSLELSPESHKPEIREKMGKFAVSNEAIEDTLRAALDNGCRNVDVFFMIGLPEQSYEDAVGAVEYAEHLLTDIDDDRVVPFIAPLAPFLDPGSPAFENPEAYGYEPLAETLEEHRQLLLEPSWKRMLSYETTGLSRDDIVEATYEAAERMNRLKYEHGQLDEETLQTILDRLETSRWVVDRVDEIHESIPDGRREAELQAIAEEVPDFGEYSIAGEDELWWKNDGLRGVPRLASVAGKLLVGELRQRL
ncbi:TIGR04190 family B12-binding domain/radical SAM domain protein [Halapricum desulfuricans]|uniref:TIGR04190 family B12-binding domain/radical SAM domain protein n=1 Tax=Halapricum desulfuricans TaxID=2841257 RepID=UPI001E495EAE|nr:TIGR04190 family B12-binding domain/radical SAM domain protein [Halapricum desulfuricans]